VADAGNPSTARVRRIVTPGSTRLLNDTRPRRGDRSGVDEPRRWRARPLIWIAASLTILAAFVFVLWLAWSFYVLFLGHPSPFGFDPDRRCAQLGFSCGALSNIATSVLLLAIASAFLLWRLYRLLGRYRARARDESRELVPTAGTILEEVVGRDELCKVLMVDLHDPGTRPHILVGGVGTGKTAVLVKLTEYLADKGAVPVPIRLRDAGHELDFENLARARFLDEVDKYVLNSAEGETIWRRLRKDGKIVVLADGLEEALLGNRERDNIIRAAIRNAHTEHLPLIIASRPHDPLRATEATILVLEPLSYEAALAYIGSGGTRESDRRLAWIVETADVVEAPLYLQITRELHDKGLLEPSSAGQHGVVDTRGADRATLRLGLLQTWERALVRGHLYEDIPLNRAERQAAVEHVSALACAGLVQDLLDVGLDDPVSDKIAAEVKRRLAKVDELAGRATGVGTVDVRLAAAWAARLELVELRGESVRFPHSLMQAYLGSRLLDAALQDLGYCRKALESPRPGREFLIALVLRSRAADRASAARPDPSRQDRTGLRWARRASPPSAQNDSAGLAFLTQTAAERDDNKVLDMYAAALEIDCVADEPAHVAIAEQIVAKWPQIHAHDPRTLEEGKLGLVHRFGEAARGIDARRRQGEGCSARPAYQQLYEISCQEWSYPVQLAAAQEIGAGRDAAYQALEQVLTAPCEICEDERAGGHANKAGGHPSRSTSDNQAWRAWIISAWLAPMLAAPVNATASGLEHRDLEAKARADLARWLRHIGYDARRPGEEDLPISLEIALAQGFKYAANRRPRHADDGRETRMYLAEQALEMLKGARYWFSQLTLIQALCLLNMSDGPRPAGDKYGAKPDAIVQHWLDVTGRERAARDRRAGGPAEPHPFVREASQLAVLALKTGYPQRYCWIDESGVVGQVGSRNTGASTGRHSLQLWIPPSAGWTALNGRAQRLVADVLLLLNLAERGDQPRDRERRLKRANRPDLPPCITRSRVSLNPGRTVGTAISSAPGTSCVDGCAFELCPYPPKGVLPRAEMSEAFCRRQQTLLTRRFPGPRTAPWQQMPPAQLTAFWAEMADRARDSRPRPSGAGRDRGK
jgi:hypothetical protein